LVGIGGVADAAAHAVPLGAVPAREVADDRAARVGEAAADVDRAGRRDLDGLDGAEQALAARLVAALAREAGDGVGADVAGVLEVTADVDLAGAAPGEGARLTADAVVALARRAQAAPVGAVPAHDPADRHGVGAVHRAADEDAAA